MKTIQEFVENHRCRRIRRLLFFRLFPSFKPNAEELEYLDFENLAVQDLDLVNEIPALFLTQLFNVDHEARLWSR
jgi:hypothetical protein